jgi:hypothetical protein
MHEIIHVLGFSSTLFSFFRDGAGSPRTARCPNAAGCTSHDQVGFPPYNPSKKAYAVSSSTVVASSRRGSPVTFLATPSVRSVVRAHFGCTALPGAELENEGSSDGTVGSHLEKRLFFTELMTGSKSDVFPEYLSEITLAVLADSGWYRVNYSWADAAPLNFGRGLGCGFVDVNCQSASSYPYCSTEASAGVLDCSYDRSSLGRCLQVPLMDGCGVFYSYTNTLCLNSSEPSPVLLACQSKSCRGSYFGPGSG